MYQYWNLPFGIALSPCIFTHGCSTGYFETSGHSCTQLHRRLADFSLVSGDGSSTSIYCPHPHKAIGVKTKCEKVSLSAKGSLPGTNLVLDYDTGTICACACIKSILPAVFKMKQGQAITAKQFKRLLGLMAAMSSMIPFGFLYMRTNKVVAQNQGLFSLRGTTFCIMKA